MAPEADGLIAMTMTSSPKAIPSPVADTLLSEVVRRLAAHPSIEGVALGGSGRDSAMTPVSDIDLLIVVEEAWASLRGGVTQIDGRIGDLMFVTTSKIQELTATGLETGKDVSLPFVAPSLANARILFARAGRLARARDRMRPTPSDRSGARPTERGTRSTTTYSTTAGCTHPMTRCTPLRSMCGCCMASPTYLRGTSPRAGTGGRAKRLPFAICKSAIRRS